MADHTTSGIDDDSRFIELLQLLKFQRPDRLALLGETLHDGARKTRFVGAKGHITRVPINAGEATRTSKVGAKIPGRKV